MKFIEFFEKKKRLCRTPGHCTRCGKVKGDDSYKTCEPCRKRNASNMREKRLDDRAKVAHVALIRRIESLENAVARLQKKDIQFYAKVYQIGKKTGMKKREAIECREISKQELATINHAYDLMS